MVALQGCRLGVLGAIRSSVESHVSRTMRRMLCVARRRRGRRGMSYADGGSDEAAMRGSVDSQSREASPEKTRPPGQDAESRHVGRYARLSFAPRKRSIGSGRQISIARRRDCGADGSSVEKPLYRPPSYQNRGEKTDGSPVYTTPQTAPQTWQYRNGATYGRPRFVRLPRRRAKKWITYSLPAFERFHGILHWQRRQPRPGG